MVIRSIFFNLCLVVITMLLGLVAIIIPSKKNIKFIAILWAKLVIYFFKLICKVKINVIGLENIPNKPFLIASKHQSALDIMLLILYLDFPKFIMKESLKYLPFIGALSLKMKMILINRKKGAAALKQMIIKSREAFENKDAVVIFPEGTRTKPGEDSKFHPGVKAIYSSCDVSTLPVALNTGKVWPRNSFIKREGEIFIKFLPVIEAKMQKDKYIEYLRSKISSESNI